MHEISVAQEIFRIVHQYVPDPKPNTVKSVKVSIGKLSNVLKDSLTFCFDAITSDTPLKGTRLDIIELPVKIQCASCNEVAEIDEPVFVCPNCGENQIIVISGTELKVDEIELFDENQFVSALQSRDREEQ
ncbi:MAG: hydrogenase maturation nickel metallochaperone HypA [Ignavibacteriaceae bacterium]|nr:hydrogenase maturation nickel metallochaperone HypA [Ignavibacteriaceae bacterium]